MYNINPLMRNVLITANEVIFHAPTKHTLDARAIEHSIIIAEERFIRPELDFAFYTDLCNEKNKEVTELNKAELQAHFPNRILKDGDIVNAYEFLSTYNQQIWRQHLWKLIAECVMVIAYPEAWVQFGTQGVQHTIAPASPMGGGDAAVSPELRSIKWMMDKKLQDRIDPLIQSLHSYLCRMRKLTPLAYPLYTKYCSCDDEKKESKRTDIILGLYDEPETYCGCR